MARLGVASLRVSPRETLHPMTRCFQLFRVLSGPMALEPIRKITWQAENCFSCKWFRPSDPLNADLFTSGLCVHPKLKPFDLVIGGRDWCNLFEEITQKQIDAVQAKAMKGAA